MRESGRGIPGTSFPRLARNSSIRSRFTFSLAPARFREGIVPSLFWPLPVLESLRAIAKSNSDYRHPSRATRCGFQLLVDVVAGDYQLDFESWHEAGIVGDRLSSRAFFRGVDASEWPTTSPLGRMAKRFQGHVLATRDADSWATIATALDQLHREFVMPARRALARNFQAAHQGERETIVRWIATVRLANAAYHTTTLGFARQRAAAGGRLRNPPTASSDQHLFRGYVNALTDVWRRLIPDEALRDEAISQLGSFRSWNDLNALPNLLWTRGTEALGGERRGLLRQMRPVTPEQLLSLTRPRREAYTLTRRLNQALMWYETATLGPHGETPATGAAMFVSLVKGESEGRREHRISSPLEVVRFKHLPTGRDDVTWFSYGVLLERGGFITDASQWLLSLRLGGDYRGSGGLAYAAVEAELARLGKRVHVTEVEVSYAELVNYLRDNDIIFTSLAGLDEILRDGPDLKAELGRMLASFERCVIVLGNYRTSRTLLDRIAAILRNKGYAAFLVGEFPDNSGRTVDQKVQLLMNLARFCVMLDDYPSGHIAEYPIARENLVILARLTPSGGGSTLMIGSAEIAGVNHIRKFSFKKSPVEVLETAVAWAEDQRTQRLDRLRDATAKPA